MRKAVSGKKKEKRLYTEKGTIFTRVTKNGVVRFYAQYYDRDRKLKEKVLRFATDRDEAILALNNIYDEEFRAKHNIAPKHRRSKLNDFVEENEINGRIRGHVLNLLGDKSLDEITELEVLKYVGKREEAGARNNTIYAELIALRKTLYLAKRSRYSIDDLIKWGNCMPKQEFRDRVLNDEEEEEQRLMPKLAEYLKPIVICALNTGLGKEDILGLKWENIVDGTIVLKYHSNKTRQARRIKINSRLQQVLELLRSRNGSEFVFTRNDNGKRIKDIQADFSEARQEAGIKDFWFRDLRRTFATRLMRNGVGIYTISKLLGHASVTMTEKYLNWQPIDGADAVESLVKSTPKPRKILGMENAEQFQSPLITSRVS